jgi:hypothetical protein
MAIITYAPVDVVSYQPSLTNWSKKKAQTKTEFSYWWVGLNKINK